MPLLEAPNYAIARGRNQVHWAAEIEMWKGQDGYVVAYKHMIEGRGLVSWTGIIWAYLSKEEPPREPALLQKLCARSFLIGRTLFEHDVKDLLLPYKLAEVLTK